MFKNISFTKKRRATQEKANDEQPTKSDVPCCEGSEESKEIEKKPKSPFKRASSQTVSHPVRQDKTSHKCCLNCGLSPCGKSKSESQLLTQHDEDFWRRNFQVSSRVEWTEFRAAFLNDYGKQLKEFSHERFHWILNILHVEVFGGDDVILKTGYDRFCGHSHEPDKFWLKVKEYAIDRIFKEGVAESLFG